MRTHNQTASDRREAVLDAAVSEFALKGLHGTSTEDIARRAGISQPYIFRLFGTKKELFTAVAERVCNRIRRTFEQALAAGGPGDALNIMGRSYITLLSDRHELLLMLHAFAASGDPEVQATVKRSYEQLVEYVREASGAAQEEISAFFAQGMLLTVAVAIDSPKLVGCISWAELARKCEEEPESAPWRLGLTRKISEHTLTNIG